MGWRVDDTMPRGDGLRIWNKILKKIQLSSDHDAEKFSSGHCIEKLGSDHGFEKLGSDRGVEKLGSDRSVERLKSDHAVEGWYWTMEADSWVLCRCGGGGG